MKQGWEIKKLGEVCKKITNIKWNEIEETTSFPYIDLSAVDRENSSIHDYEYINISNAPSRAKQIVKVGDILFATTRPMLKRACIIPNEFNNAIASTGFCVLRPQGTVLSEWIYHNIKSNRFYKYIEPIQKGVSYPAITDNEVKDFCIPVPPREEQERIVAELDCLSGVIERKREQLRELDALAQSIFYQMFGDPITNEKGWEVKKLGEMGKVITGNTPSTKDEENYSSNDYCFVKPSDIGKDYVTKIENTEFYISEKAFSQSRRLSKGSVLTTCIGIIGKVGILKVDATCNQQINAILPDENSISEYVAWAIYLTRSVLENIANAPVVPIINKGEFSNIVIPLPPEVLQQEFADKIEAIEKQKELIKQSITQTEELFNSRMDYYFN